MSYPRLTLQRPRPAGWSWLLHRSREDAILAAELDRRDEPEGPVWVLTWRAVGEGSERVAGKAEADAMVRARCGVG